MRLKSAAASLVFWDPHFDSIRLQHAYRSAVQFGETDAGNAASKKCYAAAALTSGGKHQTKLIEVKLIVNGRGQRFDLVQPEQSQNSDVADQPLQSRMLVEAQQPRPA